MPFTPVASQFVVNTTTIGDQFESSITALANGQFVVVWQSDTGLGGDLPIKGQIYNADGTPSGGEFSVNGGPGEWSGDPYVAALTSGGFVVTWTEFNGDPSGFDNGIRGQVMSDTGMAVGPQLVINTTTAQSQRQSSITTREDGSFLVLWDSPGPVGGQSYVLAQLYSASGVAIGGEIPITTVSAFQSQGRGAELSDGRMVVAWTDYTSTIDGSESATRFQILSSTGVQIGSPTIGNTSTIGSQVLVEVMANADGGFTTFYINYSRANLNGRVLTAQSFDAAGVAVGSEIAILSRADRIDFTDIDRLDDGSYAVTYSTTGDPRDTSGGGVFVETFDANFAPIGSSQIANTTTTGFQSAGGLAVVGGQMMVVWHTSDSATDGDSFAIVARVFSGTSAPVIGTNGADTLTAPDNSTWTVDGGAGNDILTGLGGNDAIIGGRGSDTLAGGGGNDVIDGGIGNDRMAGDDGNDTLVGGAGIDQINGGAGDDIVNGGAGRDVVTGGTGQDDFLFDDGDFAGVTGSTSDRITDFSKAQGDIIDLSAVDAIFGGADNGFAFIGNAAFGSVAGQLRYQITGGNTLVTGDINGDGTADFMIRLDGAVALVAADFVL